MACVRRRRPRVGACNPFISLIFVVWINHDMGVGLKRSHVLVEE
jgi:hypothetical protein